MQSIFRESESIFLFRVVVVDSVLGVEGSPLEEDLVVDASSLEEDLVADELPLEEDLVADALPLEEDLVVDASLEGIVTVGVIVSTGVSMSPLEEDLGVEAIPLEEDMVVESVVMESNWEQMTQNLM